VNQYVLYVLLALAGAAIRHLFPNLFGQAGGSAGSGNPESSSPLLDHFWQEVETGIKQQLQDAVKKFADGILNATASATATKTA
jgi:hypothetical protein